MTKTLKEVVEALPFPNQAPSDQLIYSGQRENYSPAKSKGYSVFAEMYLEKPVEVQDGLTASVSTWKGVPTIDDW